MDHYIISGWCRRIDDEIKGRFLEVLQIQGLTNREENGVALLQLKIKEE